MQEPLKRTPLKEMTGGREKLALGNEPLAVHNSSSSSEFMKMWSPMAEKMAETARRSTNGEICFLQRM